MMIVESLGKDATRWSDPRERARLAIPDWWIKHEVAEVRFSDTDSAMVDLDDKIVEPLGVFLLEGACGMVIGRYDGEARTFAVAIPAKWHGVRLPPGDAGAVLGRVKSMWSTAGL